MSFRELVISIAAENRASAEFNRVAADAAAMGSTTGWLMISHRGELTRFPQLTGLLLGLVPLPVRLCPGQPRSWLPPDFP